MAISRMRNRRRPPTRSRVRAHPFVDAPELVDAYVPADRRGIGPRRWCRSCSLPGEPGDDRHPESPRIEQLLAEAAAIEARITGDREPALV